jgi:hypothetical protein
MWMECLAQALISGARVALEIPDTIIVAPKLENFLLITNWTKGLHHEELKIVKIRFDQISSIFKSWKRRKGKSKTPLCVTKSM